ncbi:MULTISPECIES: TetR/AcrR family transcriptional regulator [unclassified Pseudomonas]|uniref:TetR/AcrR family transcriptional regulator n=1 Tax=unclassified Pseudomonas TaxID=196821 RepID=UPI000D39275C|nr:MULTISPECIES: TetR/AcrR family transcriptional regulator [unclassified Pseudomonas]RAU47976.1 TetR/AcrR family transcriptional regulator [Pseudomonas sp. RIT 409]RAU55330.1 TetR/AcrR family transcriptional regulator [Pseudomonas sp. RIT 412]
MNHAAGPGRPRQFELEDAARNAMNVFWDRGYEGASLPDLIEGTGLSRGSLYKAFGDKKGLLLAAIDVYSAQALKVTADILSQPGTARHAIQESMLRHARSSSGEEGRRGCLLVAVANELVAQDLEVGQRIARMLHRTRQLYASAIIRGQAAGEFAEGDEQEMAHFLVCQIEGMRVLGKTGAREADMTALVERSMRLLNS